MGTAKRERQKANRQLRLEELAKQARKQKSKRFGMRIAIGAVLVVAVVGGVYLLSGDDETTTAATTTVPTEPTIDPNAPTTTFVPAPEKPVVTKPDGDVTELVVTTLREGTGDVVLSGDTISVYYVGTTSIDGVEFESNYESGTGPVSFAVGVGRLIQGWDEGLVGLKVGGQYRLDIPVDLAYGPDAAANGKPAGALTFIVDIVGVTHAAPADTTPADTAPADTTAPVTT
ncbi:MAG: FKBP-type peptidyl-prolyl cis-trans isomerase [Actinomycetota bacterium]|nr:FKBP-type peptidyl-prolyl cis-trans isomerase [Actinomycetota bacterium]